MAVAKTLKELEDLPVFEQIAKETIYCRKFFYCLVILTIYSRIFLARLLEYLVTFVTSELRTRR